MNHETSVLVIILKGAISDPACGISPPTGTMIFLPSNVTVVDFVPVLNVGVVWPIPLEPTLLKLRAGGYETTDVKGERSTEVGQAGIDHISVVIGLGYGPVDFGLEYTSTSLRTSGVRHYSRPADILNREWIYVTDASQVLHKIDIPEQPICFIGNIYTEVEQVVL